MEECLPRRQRASAAGLFLSSLFVACSTSSYTQDADLEVSALLGRAESDVLGNRREWIETPTAPAPEPEPTQPAAAPGTQPGTQPGSPSAPPPAPLVPTAESYDLQRALTTAVRLNREFLVRRESLYRQGLSASFTRFQFGPQFSSVVSLLWPDSEGAASQPQSSIGLSARQILPTGGTLGVTGSVDGVWPYGPQSGDNSYGTSLGVSLSQPLLRGAGYEVSHEALTATERELVYGIRDFELFRESFSIQIAQRFFELASQRKTLANEDANYEGAVFDRGKAEALRQVGRNAEQEVFRARRREIEAKDQLINARADYDRAVDQFKILLGLPTTVVIELADPDPPYIPVHIDADSAVAAARHNRLDLITERQRLEDSERALRIAENGLLPDLSLVANYGLSGQGNEIDRASPDRWGSSIGVQFTLPLQQKSERNNYRSAQISLEQARRALALQEDQLDLDIRDELRRLKSIEERIALQEEQIIQEQAAVTVTQIRYESGKLENRDLLEARQALVNAQNALIRLKVEHFVARLTLQKDLGIFFVDDKGMWR
jgi:outer membrane protein TolC